MDNDSYVGKDINISLEDEDKKYEGNITGQEKIEAIHSKILDEMIPKVGIEFKSEDEAYNFYNAYAYKVGFGMRRSKGHKDQSGKMTNRTFYHCCEGFREKDKRNINVKSHRAETRFGWLARMKINLNQTGKYHITDFIAQHTHVTSTPSKSHLHRSQRKLTFVQAAEIDIDNSSGIAPKASLELMAKRVGGYENLGFIHDDYKNYVKTKRTIQMKVDAKMMIEYSHFGDAVSFDTTYRKDQSGRSLAMFLGVNHHKQTTIFGIALLYDESAEIFIWLFDTFVKGMLGKKPKIILTDQDPAMAKALTSQWPETCNQLCIWHLYQNAAKHLSGAFAKFREFAKDFSSCIYDYEDKQEFFLAWNAMLEKYDLKDNDWLITNRLIEDRRYEELKVDFKATQSTPSLSFPVEILKDAVSIYTQTVFKVFQDELCKAYDCAMQIFDHIGTVTEYKLTNHKKQFQQIVRYDFSDNTVICSCRKFKFTGILCSHVLKVLSSKDIKKIPIQYIMKQWTKSAKLGNSKFAFANTINEDPKVSLARCYKDLCRLQTQVATKAAETEEIYKIARTALAKILEYVDAYLKDNNIGKSISKSQRVQAYQVLVRRLKELKIKKEYVENLQGQKMLLKGCERRKMLHLENHLSNSHMLVK
ncbi:protein FAR1-RELATED SEQUENCE 5-like [Ziziphus jujuba]|uniref:Protein FAR1-RELATED SEQUENCE 5-like n=1 Tax=Ziziphus jujuba TaxID=326968 RepID=A0ABM3I935_ZIZJJ|nr:protein FAR1-RELATED SEQUENCE 5-like [Ziziphus jujuba]